MFLAHRTHALLCAARGRRRRERAGPSRPPADSGRSSRAHPRRARRTLSDQISLIQLPLIDSRHPRVLTVKAALDRGSVPSDFEPLTSEIRRALQDALADVDVLIAHNVCSLNKNLALTAALHRLDRPRADPVAPRSGLDHAALSRRTARRLSVGSCSAPTGARGTWSFRNCASANWPSCCRIPIESIAVVPNGIDQAAFYQAQPDHARAAPTDRSAPAPRRSCCCRCA